MSGKQKFTVVTLSEREGFSREDVEAGIPPEAGDSTTCTFVVAAPIEALVLTMNQPLVALEALAGMARRQKRRVEGVRSFH